MPLTLVNFTDVVLRDKFWLPRLESDASTLVPLGLANNEVAIENLRRTATSRRGEPVQLAPAARYIASDLFKVMEGAAYILSLHPDRDLEARMDEIIDVIIDAQLEDGYLYEQHIGILSEEREAIGERPYAFEEHSHETYNMGHMYEAAVAYAQATGKTAWLDASERSARHIHRVFFDGDPAYNDGRPVNVAPGHQEIELALIKLFQQTGDPSYLRTSERFLEIRGVMNVPDGEGAAEYSQQHLPVAEQTEAVGHSVRALYQYTAMADVEALHNDGRYAVALDALWTDLVSGKMHITGGLGAEHNTEGFGVRFQLPNVEAYNETCAGVANVLFNMRMLRLTSDAVYADVAEVALYNNVLAGISLSGDRFFYTNPLECDGEFAFHVGGFEREEWFGTACCPTNLSRLIPQVPGLVYATEGTDLSVVLYVASTARVTVDGQAVEIVQEGTYPLDGDIALTLNPDGVRRFRLLLRIPTWARGDAFVPGGLYSFVDGAHAESWTVSVNGEPTAVELDNGFAVLDREWRPGDRVDLRLPMPIRRSSARAEVEADRGRIAITRGPLVFCAEETDNGGRVQRLSLASDSDTPDAVRLIEDGPLAGLPTLTVPGRPIPVSLIPYFAWANRGVGTMAVWLPVDWRSADG